MTAEPLTAHQVRCLAMLADGLTDRQIANRLGVAIHTARNHVVHLRQQLGAVNRTHAVAIGYRTGLLTLEDV